MAKKTSNSSPLAPGKSVATSRTICVGEKVRISISVALGIAIPALSLTLAHIAGTLARTGIVGLAFFLGGCGISVLVVSLSHVAEAIRHCTGAKPWQGWALAVTLDLSIVGSELVSVFAPEAGLSLWVTGLMLVVAGASMVLNVYAFLMNRGE